MVRNLVIRDVTLRDSQQSAADARMSLKQIERLLPHYNEARFYAVEVWGGEIPYSTMRYLNEDPWHRLEIINREIGHVSGLSALSRGRNLLGQAPYPDEIIEGFCRNTIRSGIQVMRMFDALNDIDNLKSSIRYVKKYGGRADCAICYAIDPHHSAVEHIRAALHGEPLHKPIFTDEYFLKKALQLEALGADMITLKDVSGLIPPSRAAELIRLFKKQLKAPVCFHTHCTAGYGLASTLMAIVHGADMVDTAIWNLAGGRTAPAIELIYLFCRKMGIEPDINLEAVAHINAELQAIFYKHSPQDSRHSLPIPFYPLDDKLPAEINRFFNEAIEAARREREDELLYYCQAIEGYFHFPKPNELVMKANLPEIMYTHLASQLRQSKKSHLMEQAMILIPGVRMDAGLPPLVTPTAQIIATQALLCAEDDEQGLPPYTHLSNSFVALVKGEYGKTPLPIDPAFRLKVTGQKEEVPYDGTLHLMQDNPLLEGLGVPLAETEKEELLLELFPTAARHFLTKQKEGRS